MLDIYPDYYGAFTCLAGSCPDTCCAQWEVVVDNDTAARYASVPGSLGQRLRAAMVYDEDGDRVLRHIEGYCPLLERSSGLCGVQLALGHDALCRVCREFPRLCQDYTVFREHSLSAACPEAARLLLLSPRLPRLSTTGTQEPAGNLEYDEGDLAFLQKVRAQMFQILDAESFTFPEKAALCLILGKKAQEVLDGGAPTPFSPEEALEQFRSNTGSAPWQEVLSFYRDMEILTPDWANRLDRALVQPQPHFEAADPFRVHPQEFSNLLFDGLYRTLFCAVADFDLLLRVKAAVLSCVLCRLLIFFGSGSQEDRLRIYQLYAKEVEHCVQNKDALLDACCLEPPFSTNSIFSLLC